jgi:hypothetical protein
MVDIRRALPESSEPAFEEPPPAGILFGNRHGIITAFATI